MKRVLHSHPDSPNLETQSQSPTLTSESVHQGVEVLSTPWTSRDSRAREGAFVRTLQEVDPRDVLLALSQVCLKELAQQLLRLASRQLQSAGALESREGLTGGQGFYHRIFSCLEKVSFWFY